MAGPQSDDLRDIGQWLIYAGVFVFFFLLVFFLVMGLLYYSLVLISLAATLGVSYWFYLKYGFKEILEKPYTMENLKATLDSVLESEN